MIFSKNCPISQKSFPRPYVVLFLSISIKIIDISMLPLNCYEKLVIRKSQIQWNVRMLEFNIIDKEVSIFSNLTNEFY